MKNMRQKSAGSLKNKIPIKAVPTAPIPVHTAYAVPIGSFCVAFTRRIILTARHSRNPAYHPMAVEPLLSLAFPKHAANATSNRPAIIKMIQFIVRKFRRRYVIGSRQQAAGSGQQEQPV